MFGDNDSSVSKTDGRTLGPGMLWVALVGVGLLSALVSILYLTGSLFMREMFCATVPSNSSMSCGR